jgi:hypothetical protein
MNKSFYLIFFLILSYFSYGNTTPKEIISNEVIQKSIGLGNVIAITISWSKNKSILLAIIHGILGWLYVVYYAIQDLKK